MDACSYDLLKNTSEALRMATVNMSLDEIIRKSKATRSGSGGGGGKKSSGVKSRERGSRNFPSAATRGSGIEGKWKHDLFHEMQTVDRVERKAARSAPKIVTKSVASKDARISITNLPQDIIDLDLEEMFQPFNFQRVQVNYNSEGVSLGTADVFFDRASDASRALKEFVGALIDGVPLKMVLLAEGGAPSISERLSVPKAGSTHRSGGGFRKEGAGKSLRSPINGRINKKTKRSSAGGAPKTSRFLDRLADDEDFKRQERSTKKLQDLDRELDEYMSHNKKQGVTKMEE